MSAVINIPSNKKIVCITGTVWTGSQSAPRHLLEKDGFVRPLWFTTRMGITDADYKRISTGAYKMACYNDDVLAHLKYGAENIGIMIPDLVQALTTSDVGALVVGPHEIAAQLGRKIPSTIIFALKDAHMKLSSDLDELNRKGQLHRLNVDALQASAWHQAYDTMRQILNL